MSEASAAATEDDAGRQRQRLASGFAWIRQKRPPFLPPRGNPPGSGSGGDGGEDTATPQPEVVSRQKSLPVHFLDPGSSLRASFSSSIGSATRMGELPNANLFEKISAMLERDYQNTVPNLAYQDVRSKAQNRIDSVRVQCHKLESVVLLEEIPPSPAQWHTLPACHVYLVSCSSVEDYRQRIKPSIQAFVSQLTDQRDRPYLLVYCPLTDAAFATTTASPSQSTDDAAASEATPPTTAAAAVTSTTSTTSSLGTVLAQRPAARAGLALANRVRQRFHQATASTSTTGSSAPEDDPHDDTAGGGGGLPTSPPSSSGGGTALGDDVLYWSSGGARTAHMTRNEREVYRRLQADFGPMCALSVPSIDPQSTQSFKKAEWTAFLQSLAAALARGLQEHCHKYDEALRHLDAQRKRPPPPPPPHTNHQHPDDGNGRNRPHHHEWDVTQYFLVKESWAFLYEQYNLPAEALLQYKEARILLPDIRGAADGGDSLSAVDKDVLSGIEGTETRGHHDAAAEQQQAWRKLSQMVQRGDLDAVRRELAGIRHLEPIAPALEDYLYVRETDLLFQMVDPMEVLVRSLAHVTAMVDFRLEQASTVEEQLEIHQWGFCFCWDLKEASRSYLPDSALEGAASSRRPVVENVGRTICDVLAYARWQLLQMAKLHKMDGLNIPTLSTDLQTTWEPWSPEMVEKASETTSKGRPPVPIHDSRALLKDAFASGEAFQDCYLEIMKVAIAYNTLAGRQRAAARLRMEVVEILTQRGLTHEAASTLKTTAAVYERDGWMECSFMLLFRLAGFERNILPPTEYLQTLFKCMAVAHRIMAPPKALAALQADLDAVVKTDDIQGLSLEASPVFFPVLGLPGRFSVTTADRKLVRKVCSVGEEASIALHLSNCFCNSVEDVSITIDLVSYQAHVLAAEEGTLTKKSDVVRVLSLDSRVVLKPGANEFIFSWMPLSSGQFVAAGIEMEWNGIRFTYTSKEFQKPLVRIDILPADADQSMAISPAFLLQGHEQPLHIEFSPGLDDVESGEIQFDCSPGLVMLPPGETADKAWSAKRTIALPACQRGKPLSLTANVKTVDTEEWDAVVPTITVKITTQYRSIPTGVSDEDAGKHESAGVLLTHQMEYQISALNSKALTVEDISLTSHKMGQMLLAVAVKCHTPEPFTIRGWNLQLPSYLTLQPDVDLNAGITGTTAHDEEVIYFCFVCDSHLGEIKSPGAAMVVDLVDPQGFVFHERLDLRIRRAGLPRIEIPHFPSIPVKVDLSTSQGPVGAPVEVSYSFDTAALASWKGSIIYSIAMDSQDWILSGCHQGLVDHDEAVCQVQCVAVPVRPGIHTALPELFISLAGEGLERPFPLTVRVTPSSAFQAQAPSSQSTIMYATYEC